MGCGLTALRDSNVKSSDISRYIAVEISKDAKRIACNANPHEPNMPNIDHSWHSNAWDITEQDIAKLGHNNIKMFMPGPPCQDFSKLRLLVKRSARKSLNDIRPGLDGPPTI